jgi:hypothetical protein
LNSKTIKLNLFLILLLLLSSPAFAADWCANANMKWASKMEEASGNLLDCTSAANPLVACSGTSAGAYRSTGQFSYAFDFQQVNNAGFYAATDSNYINIRTITTGAWIAVDTDGDAGGFVVGIWDGSDGHYIKLAGDATDANDIQFRYQWTGGPGQWRSSGNAIPYDSVFLHFAVTYDSGSTANDPIFYKNGASIGRFETNTPATAPDDNTGAELTVGITGDGTNCGTTGEFDGDIDEPFVYSGILDSTDINSIVDDGLAGAVGGDRRVIMITKAISDDLTIYMGRKK